jgi:hypothetical protein
MSAYGPRSLAATKKPGLKSVPALVLAVVARIKARFQGDKVSEFQGKGVASPSSETLKL